MERIPLGMADFFENLESNDADVVEVTKQKIHDQLNNVSDSWIVFGLYEYYLISNSIRCMEILVNIREPHCFHLFNKLNDSIRGNKHEIKVRALTLLGHILRKEPPWLYKITEHSLLKEILRLLRNETDILLLLSALLVLVVLLPTVPSRMGHVLPEVFEIFSRLAAWNCSNPEKLIEEQMVHLQVALYALFQRLYGMYPCNFLAYLRHQYRSKDQIPVFVHTVKPMLESVKMHPYLVTASKEKETTTERWKKMGAHDVVVECERFSLDVGDRCYHESCYLTNSFRSRSGTTNSNILEPPNQPIKSSSVSSISSDTNEFFSPSRSYLLYTPPVADSTVASVIPFSHLQPGVRHNFPVHEGTSPPEAAIEATPETTPIRDVVLTRPLPSSSVQRAFASTKNWSGNSSTSTPNQSQPSSPMHKEAFVFSENRTSAFAASRRESYASKKEQKILQERSIVAGILPEPSHSRFIPTSPLRIIPSNESNLLLSSTQRLDSPVSLEDEEVLEIVKQVEYEDRHDLRQCDSVLQEIEGGRIAEEELERVQEHGSPCTAGGLHMPNSKSLNSFAKRVQRIRYYSQCGSENVVTKTSSGSSPGNSTYQESKAVRRATSCPEIEKVPTQDNTDRTSAKKDGKMKGKFYAEGKLVRSKIVQKKQTSVETQTDQTFWVMPYEHLFVGIFPSMENCDVKPSPAPSPAPYHVPDKFPTTSPYDLLDKYIEIAAHGNDRDSIKSLKQQLQLLHQQLLFERQRREMHAFKNRRLLADAKNTRALEEHNSALRDQVQLQQREIEILRGELDSLRKEGFRKGKESLENAHYWESRCTSVQQECENIRIQNEEKQEYAVMLKVRCMELDKKWQHLESSLLDAEAEIRIAREHALAGERGKVECEQLSKELLLAGEMQLKYLEHLTQIQSLRRSDYELVKSTETYTHEIKVLKQQLDSKVTLLEAYRSRIAELEKHVNQNEERSLQQKRHLNEVKEECDEKLKSVESKYQNQLLVIKCLEERILELHQRLEITNRPSQHSPDISSCHEVHATMTDRTSLTAGLSPHSSPLSASLASSEGSLAFAQPDMKETRNLQMLSDQRDPTTSTSGTHLLNEDEKSLERTFNIAGPQSPSK